MKLHDYDINPSVIAFYTEKAHQERAKSQRETLNWLKQLFSKRTDTNTFDAATRGECVIPLKPAPMANQHHTKRAA